MERTEILERLGSVVAQSSAEAIDWTGVDESTELDSFGFDSLSVLDLLFDLEQEFGVTIAPQKMLALDTVGELITLIVEETAGAQ